MIKINKINPKKDYPVINMFNYEEKVTTSTVKT